VLARRAEFAEPFAHLLGFEVDAFDLVVGAAALDGAPLDDVIGGGAERVAQVGLLDRFPRRVRERGNRRGTGRGVTWFRVRG